MVKESDLYAPVKALLETRGYSVKAEINDCDVVACKEGLPPVIVELKLVFTLELVFQAINRQNRSDDIYLAVLAPNTPAKRKNWRSRRRDCVKLCRLLGLGLMTVDLTQKPGRQTDVLLDPCPYRPRKNRRQQTRLMTEFTARRGDPNTGGVSRTIIITSYRQDALRCAVALSDGDNKTVADIKAASGTPRTATILQKNYYGWFERTSRGVYCLSPLGREGLQIYAEVIPTLGDNSG